MTSRAVQEVLDALDDDPEPLGDDEVLEAVREFAGGAVAERTPMRLQPQGGDHPGPDRVYCMPVPLEDGRFLAVLFSFGQASDDAMEDWKPTWRDVAGPLTREEAEELGRELASR